MPHATPSRANLEQITANYAFVRINKSYVKLNYADILYVEAVRNYVKIVTTTQKSYLLLGTISDIEEDLPKDSFCRIHRSFIVPLILMTAFDCEVVRIGDREFPVGKIYKCLLFEKVKILLPKKSIN